MTPGEVACPYRKGPVLVASWNINSVRKRIDQVARFVAEAKPDVLCLQEIKCRDGEFPASAFRAMGLPHLHVVGPKGWHGVAIASRLPIDRLPNPPVCPHREARACAVRVKGVELHGLYLPAGGELPNAETNPKFAHKLHTLERLRLLYTAAANPSQPLIVLGDMNVAPGEHDVWSHQRLLQEVSHTPVETTALESARTSAGLVDVARRFHPPPEKLFTWWSYRAADWAASNRGRRLDHIWASPKLAAEAKEFRVMTACRSWPSPSDHAPVLCRFAV
ncbi:MAG: exodeoxyribonuclease III [Hyphomonadaceae bacterium]|nr:exodeoxyribonuclease III [Hyphomonadaceae bacterium]